VRGRGGSYGVLRRGVRSFAAGCCGRACRRPLRMTWGLDGLLREAYETFAPIREELADKYTEAEIDEAIDQSVRAVRQARP